MSKTKTKKCTRCKKVLPLTPEYFYRNRAMASGFQSECKECRKKLTNEQRKKDVKYEVDKFVGPKGPHATPLTILGIKYKFRKGQNILIKTSQTIGIPMNKWLKATVVELYDDYMNVRLDKYFTGILYVDLLVGVVRVKIMEE